MAEDIEHRVQSLIRLAADAAAADGEARNAALLACRLIVKHSFHVGLKPAGGSRGYRPPPKEERRAEPAAATSDPAEFATERPEAMRYRGERWVAIRQKFTVTRCAQCRELIAFGAWCYWVKGLGCYHLACMQGEYDGPYT